MKISRNLGLVVVFILMLCLLPSSGLTQSGGSAEVDSIAYGFALDMLINSSKTDVDKLEDIRKQLKQAGTYQLGVEYLTFVESLLLLQGVDEDRFDRALDSIQRLSKNKSFTLDYYSQLDKSNRQALPDLEKLLQYINARKLETSGDRESAIAMYEAYPVLDAVTRAGELTNAIRIEKYDRAIALLSEGSLVSTQQSEGLFRELGSYRDSQQKLKECQTRIAILATPFSAPTQKPTSMPTPTLSPTPTLAPVLTPTRAPTPTPSNPIQTFPTNGVYFGGNLYLFVNQAKTWQEAKLDCENMGGHLAVISSDEEMHFVSTIIPQKESENHIVWIGGSDAAKEGKWEWVTGEAFSYTNWKTYEPNNYINEDYLQIDENPKWNDASDSQQCYYLCEWELLTPATSSPISKPTSIPESQVFDLKYMINSPTSITLSWADSIVEVQTYIVTYLAGGQVIRSLQTNNKSLRIDYLAPNTEYTMSVGSKGGDITNIVVQTDEAAAHRDNNYRWKSARICSVLEHTDFDDKDDFKVISAISASFWMQTIDKKDYYFYIEYIFHQQTKEAKNRDYLLVVRLPYGEVYTKFLQDSIPGDQGAVLHPFFIEDMFSQALKHYGVMPKGEYTFELYMNDGFAGRTTLWVK